VVVAFVVVLFVAVKPVMLAIEASKVPAIAVVKFASVEKRFVEVASPVIVLLDDAAPKETEPAVKFPPTSRSPEREVPPETARDVAVTGPPENDALAMLPPVIVGLVIAVPESWPMLLAAAIVFGAPPPSGGDAAAL
jgi:hypothetical protein